MTEKKLRTYFFFLLFTFRKPVNLFRGLPKWTFSSGKRLKSCREKIWKSHFALLRPCGAQASFAFRVVFCELRYMIPWKFLPSCQGYCTSLLFLSFFFTNWRKLAYSLVFCQVRCIVFSIELPKYCRVECQLYLVLDCRQLG